MYGKRLAALILTGCLLGTVGCSSSGSGSGLFSGGCCGHGSSGGGLGRLFGSNSAPAMAGGPVTSGVYAGGYGGGVDCPCSNQGGGDGVYHPAVMTQGAPSGAAVMGEMAPPPNFAQGMPIQGAPAPQYPTQQVPMITPGVPPGTPQNPMTAPPRIQPVPMAPSGVGPASGMAPASPWGPR